MNDSTAVAERKEGLVDVKEESRMEVAQEAKEAPEGQAEGHEREQEREEGEEVASLKALLEEKTQQVAQMEEQLATLREEVQKRDQEVSTLKQQLSRAIEKYRASLLASAPEVPEELVHGETVEELEKTLAQGRQMVGRIRRQIEAEGKKERVPTGAPIRKGPDLTSLSPSEKIAYGLSRRVNNG